MRISFVVLYALMLGLQLNCDRQENSVSEEHENDLKAISAISKEHNTAVNTTNVEMLLNGMTEDVVYLGQGLSPIVGKQKLRELLTPMYEQFDFNLQMMIKDITISGDLAVEWGTATGTFGPRNGGNEQEIDNTYLFVYQRQSNGLWKITRDVYNEN